MRSRSVIVLITAWLQFPNVVVHALTLLLLFAVSLDIVGHSELRYLPALVYHDIEVFLTVLASRDKFLWNIGQTKASVQIFVHDYLSKNLREPGTWY